jgi:ferric-dicitrate binding protein FerR (iron transport regulator)
MTVNDPNMVFNSLITRYLSEELSSDELFQFRQALEQEPELKLRLKEFSEIWESMDGVSEQRRYDLDAEWALMRGKTPDFTDKRVAAVKGRTLLYYSYRIAAVLLAGVIFSFAWIFATQIAGKKVVLAREEPVEILLEDGTQVVLNRNSGIRYRKQFGDDSREILLSGEAWFDVAADSTRPFVIDAGRAMVEVIGTSFNVNAYKENPTVEITVESGVVSVSAKEDKDKQMILRAGNSGSYNSNSHELSLVPAYHPNNLSWKTRNLYFEDTPLRDVADLIGKVYNVSVVIPNEELASCPITVTFSDQSLEAVLNVLEMTLDLQISRSGEKITLNGTVCIE